MGAETEKGNLSLSLKSIKNVSKHMSVPDHEDIVWFLYRDYVQALRVSCYDYLPDDKSHTVIEHVLSRLKP